MSVALTVPSGGSCSCCGCAVEVRSVTAYLQQHGYDPFDCDYLRGNSSSPQSPAPPYDRYLSYTVSGPAHILACGGFNYRAKNVTESWNVDPFTGLTCRFGPEKQSVGYLCNPGFFGPDSIQNCTETSINYDCGEYSDSDYDAECSPRPGEGEEKKRKTRSESLGNRYTINDVAANVNTMLSRVDGIVYSQMPANSSGTVLNGTGHSALTWKRGALSTASFTKGDTWVSRTRLYIKFLADAKYKLNDFEYEATKGETITVDADEGESVYFDLFCWQGYAPQDSIDYQGTSTTRTRPDSECGVTYWTGPDCKQYDTRTKTVTASSSESSSITDTIISEDVNSSTTTVINESSSYNGTTEESIGVHAQENGSAACYKKEEIFNGAAAYSKNVNGSGNNTQGPNFECPFEESSTDGSTLVLSGNVLTIGETCSGSVTRAVNLEREASDSSQCVNFGEDVEGRDHQESGSAEITRTTEYNQDCSPTETIEQSGSTRFTDISNVGAFERNTSTCNTQLSNDGTWSGTATLADSEPYPTDRPCVHLPAEPKLWTGAGCVICGGTDGECTTTTNISVQSTSFACSYSRSCSTETSSSQQSSTYTETFSNTADRDGWDTETTPNYSGCTGNYEDVNWGWQSSALLIWGSTYTLPSSQTAIQYTAWFHHVLETNDTSNPDCPFRVVVAINETFGVQSTGGQRLVTTSISVPPASKNSTVCVVELEAFLLEN